MPPLGRRDLLKALGGVAGAATAAPLAGQISPVRHPNIVFILADDMGYGDISYLNPESQIPTPNIDRIGRGGMYFTDAHSPSAICTPTRYGIHTGRYCWRTRIKRSVTWGYSRHLIEPERLTVASLLKRNGYNTGCFGKWHMGMDMPTKDGRGIQESDAIVDQRSYLGDIDWREKIANGPTAVGFDEFYGISASLDMHPYIWIDGDRFVGECTTEQDLLFLSRADPQFEKSDNTGPSHADFVAEDVQPEITRKTIDFINRQTADTPFFACMALAAPHIPIVPSKEFQGASKLGPYGDFCMQVDDSIGQVLDAVTRNKLADDTLVIFTSDNGCAPYIGVDEMNAQGHYPSAIYRGYKADIYEGGHRIPFLAQWPRRIKAGSRSDEIICLTDLLATCAAIVGGSLPADAGEDSYNILPALLAQTYDLPIREATVMQSGSGAYTIRQGPWKLELTPSSGGYYAMPAAQVKAEGLPPVQLYNLDNDIKETQNLQDKHPRIVQELSALLLKYQRANRSAPAG